MNSSFSLSCLGINDLFWLNSTYLSTLFGDMSALETYTIIHECWMLVFSLFQFITNMINVNITSVCQVKCLSLDWLFTLHMLKYLQYLQHLCLPDCLKSICTFLFTFPPFLLLLLPLFHSPLLLFLPWYLQSLSCSQSNGGLHQRCLYSPPTQLSLSLSLCRSLPVSRLPSLSLFFF